MQTATSNLVFIVSANRATFGGTTTFIDVVEKHRRYFHPVRPGWPNDPPNYIAFRWEGRLQSIHHIDDYEIITDFGPHFPGQNPEEIDPHYLYHLGPAIRPPSPVLTGSLYGPGHHWAHIDLLLTSATVSEAETKRRRVRRLHEKLVKDVCVIHAPSLNVAIVGELRPRRSNRPSTSRC